MWSYQSQSAAPCIGIKTGMKRSRKKIRKSLSRHYQNEKAQPYKVKECTKRETAEQYKITYANWRCLKSNWSESGNKSDRGDRRLYTSLKPKRLKYK